MICWAFKRCSTNTLVLNFKPISVSSITPISQTHPIESLMAGYGGTASSSTQTSPPHLFRKWNTGLTLKCSSTSPNHVSFRLCMLTRHVWAGEILWLSLHMQIVRLDFWILDPCHTDFCSLTISDAIWEKIRDDVAECTKHTTLGGWYATHNSAVYRHPQGGTNIKQYSQYVYAVGEYELDGVRVTRVFVCYLGVRNHPCQCVRGNWHGFDNLSGILRNS